jgi:hypothetical protein
VMMVVVVVKFWDGKNGRKTFKFELDCNESQRSNPRWGNRLQTPRHKMN